MWWRRTGPKLPRHPDTIAGVLGFLAKSQMRRDFEDLSMVGRKDLIRTVEGWRKRYCVCWIVGEDGMEKIGIDEVPGHNS